METQQSGGEPQPTQVPPSNLNNNNNKKWEIVVGVILIVFIIVIALYYVFFKKDTIPPVIQNSQVGVQSNELPDSTNLNGHSTIEDLKNSAFYRPYLSDGPDFNLLPAESAIKFENGVAHFSYCEEIAQSASTYPYKCADGKTKDVTVTISNVTPTPIQNPIMTYDGKPDGVALLTFDFGNGQKGAYLVAFISGQLVTNTNFYNVTNLHEDSRAIQSIGFNSAGDVEVSVRKATGEVVKRAFEAVSGRGLTNNFVELTPDGKNKLYSNEKYGFSFTYPKELAAFSDFTMRATQLEGDLNISPIYYAQECGLQPSLGDVGVRFALLSGTSNLNAVLYAHEIKNSTIFLTSSLYGYDPADWGKIKQQISEQDYVKNIQNGALLTNQSVDNGSIKGYKVRHISNYGVGRPCDEQRREQYQWVKGNLVFNLIFSEQITAPASQDEKGKLIDALFSSLTSSK